MKKSAEDAAPQEREFGDEKCYPVWLSIAMVLSWQIVPVYLWLSLSAPTGDAVIGNSIKAAGIQLLAQPAAVISLTIAAFREELPKWAYVLAVIPIVLVFCLALSLLIH